MMTFLLFGTTWFWLWITVAVGYIIWTVEKDDYNPVGATVVFLFAMTGLFIFGNKGSFIEMFEWIIQNPGYTLLAIISYIVLGVAWSFVKWFIAPQLGQEYPVVDSINIPNLGLNSRNFKIKIK